MQYKNFGALKISRMTLGTVQLGMDYGIANQHGQPTSEDAFAMLDTALAGGVSILDTARAYGESEAVLGSYLRLRPESGFTVVTKILIYSELGTDEASIESQIEDSVHTSLNTLGLQCLPLCMLHRASYITEYGSVVPRTLRRLISDGLICHAGVSIYNTHNIDIMLEDDLYEAVQLPLSVIDQRLVCSGHLDKLTQAGRMIFVRSVFLQGLLLMEEMPERFTSVSGYFTKLRRLAVESGYSIAELAIGFVKGLDGVASIVIGAETPEQVLDNLRLIDAPELPENLWEHLRSCFSDAPIEQIMDLLFK